MMKKIYPIIIALLGLSITSFAQNCNLSNNTIIANTVCSPIQTALSTGSYTLKARDGIILQPGFNLAASAGHSFTATLDNSVANQTNSYQPATVNSDPVPALDKSNCIPGTIGGSIDVSSSGAATYQLPIQVSPGSHGLQPNLSIVYSSQGGNGLLGWGWNLSGLSTISRVSKNTYYDGNFEAISLTSSDALALDGARLINADPVNQPNIYYPANNPYTKIEFSSSSNSFTVTTQDGMVMEYGKEGNSQIKASSSNTPISWAISRITDPEGNYMQFIYYGDQPNGEFRISEIKYTGNSISNQSPYNSIKFYYDKRNDASVAYVAGGMVSQGVLLTNIKVFCEGSLSKDYKFTYFNYIYSKLYSIDLTADGIKYNPTIIKWQEDYGHTSVKSDASLGSLHDYQLYSGDFNGDGRIDIAKWNRSNYISINFAQQGGGYTSSFISLPSNTSTYGPTNIDEHFYDFKDVTVIDRNNDGKDEVLVHYSHRHTVTPVGDRGEVGSPQIDCDDLVKLFTYNNTNFIEQTECSYSCGLYKHYYGDFNNDGIIERLTVKDRVVISCGGLTVPSGSIDNIDDLRLIDFDGDGRTDLLTLANNSLGTIWGYDGTQFVLKKNIMFFGKPTNFFAGDFNGDGKTDFLRYSSSWQIFYSTGTDFIQSTANINLTNYEPDKTGEILTGNQFNIATTICIDDINNDGKSDICQIIDENVDILISNGATFYHIEDTDHIFSTVTTNAAVTIQALDINLDGQKELIYGKDSYDFSGNYVSSNFQKITFTGGSLSRDLYVKDIIDGMGNKSTFTYSLYSDNRLFTPSFPKPALPVMLVRGPMQLATNLTTKNGSTVISNTSYTFQDANSHIQGAGFLGFKTITSTNSVNGFSSTSNFEYTILGATGIYSPWLVSQTSRKNNILISSVSNTMEAKKLDLSKKAFLSVITSSNSTNGLTNITTNTSVVSFDLALGRVTSQTTTVPGWTISTSTPYVAINGNVSRPSSATTTRTNTNGPFSSTVTFDYESATSLRVVKKTEAGVETTYSAFDGYGNAQNISVKAKSITRSTSCVFEGKGRFIVSNTDVVGNTATYEYRPSDGAKLWEQTANGKTIYSYSVQSGTLITTATYPDGNISTSKVGWDNTGYVYYSQKSITNGNTATTYFNALGQKAKETSYGFKGVLLTSEYTYNSDGTLLTEKLPGVLTPNTYSYWDDGRLKMVTGQNSSSLSYTYSNTKVTTNNSISGIEEKIYDALGNITDITSPNGPITYQYWPSGKVWKITAAGIETSMTYDPATLDQVTLTDPDAGTTTYAYNGFGQIETQKDNKLQLTTCIYDNATGQLLTKTGVGIDEDFKYYGSESPEKRGLLKTASRNNVTETYDYDNLGRRTSTITTGAGKTFTTTYQYNTEKRLGIITYQPIGISLKYGYDVVGNLQYVYRLKADNSTELIWEGKTKNDREQWTAFAMGNGLTTSWGYNPGNYTLNSIQTGTSSNPTGIQNLGFTFNEKGQLKNRKDNSLSEDFDYDPQNRLITSTVLGQAAVSTGYEVNGNINSTTLAGIYSYNVQGKPHAISSIAGPTGTTDQSPAILTSSSFTGDNMIAEMNNGTYKNVFTYGPSGNRFKVDQYQSNTLVSSKIYVGSCEYVLDNSGNITTSRTLISAPTGICAVYEKVGSAEGTLHYIHTDYLGSWLKITDGNGAVENSYSYDAWGRPRNPSTWVLSTISIANALVNLNAMQPRFDRGYTGHEHMAGFGLINMNGRLYDPYLQRFLSPDNVVQSPLNAQSYNRYTYCMNNPLMYTDPSGYSWWSHFTGWVGEHWKPIVTTVAAVAVGVVVGVCTAGIGDMVAIGCLSGMAGGFTGGALGTALNGGNLGQCLTAGFVGGVAGGLSGALMAGVIGGIGSISAPTNWGPCPLGGGQVIRLGQATLGNWANAITNGSLISGVSNGVLASGIGGSIASVTLVTYGMRSSLLPMPEMSPRPDPASFTTPWMDVATKEIGVEEGFIRSNPRILEYLKSAGDVGDSDETPWCASFAHWCYAQCGINGAGVNGFAYSNWGQTIKDPVYGALVITKAGHVGFYTGMDGEWVKLLGGNQHDMVSNSRHCQKSDVLKYVYPNGYIP